MPHPQENKLPFGLVLSDGMRIVVTAIDADTEATVSGVTISGVSFSVAPLDASSASDVPLPLLDPAYFTGEPG